MASVMSFAEWRNDFAYIGPGVEEGTNAEAAYNFFCSYLSPWVTAYGYKWSDGTIDTMAKKFTHLAYAIYCAEANDKYSIEIPNSVHRNLPEDRETFEHFISYADFADFCESTGNAYPPMDSLYNNYVYEFCYAFINPEVGAPGTYTQRVLDEVAHDSDDEAHGNNRASNAALPDAYANRRKHDLY